MNIKTTDVICAQCVKLYKESHAVFCVCQWAKNKQCYLCQKVKNSYKSISFSDEFWCDFLHWVKLTLSL